MTSSHIPRFAQRILNPARGKSIDRLALLLGVVVAMLVFGSSLEFSWRRELFFPRFAAMAVLLVAAAVVAYWSRSNHLVRSYSIALGVFALLALVSAAWSPFPLLSAARAVGFALMVATIVGLALTWSSPEVVRSDTSMIVSILGIAILASLALLVIRVPWAFNADRLRGFLENPNTIGVVVSLAIPLAIGLAATTDRSAGRAWWVLIIAGGLIILFAAKSRAGLVATLVALIAFAYQSRLLALKGRQVIPNGDGEGLGFVLLLTALLLTVLASVEPAIHIPLLERLSVADSSGRTSAWAVIVDLWKMRPLTGWGFGTTDQVFPGFTGNLASGFSGANAHNAYLQVLFEVGPFGLGILIFTIALALKTVLAPARDYFEAAVFATVVSGVTNQIFESGLTSAGSIIAFNFWLMVLASITLHQLSAKRALALPGSVAPLQRSSTIRDDALAS
jgi:O-antigen ligase